MAAIVATVATEDGVADLRLASWCLVHGYVTLCIGTDLEPTDRRLERAPVSRILGRWFDEARALAMRWREATGNLNSRRVAATLAHYPALICSDARFTARMASTSARARWLTSSGVKPGL